MKSKQIEELALKLAPSYWKRDAGNNEYFEVINYSKAFLDELTSKTLEHMGNLLSAAQADFIHARELAEQDKAVIAGLTEGYAKLEEVSIHVQADNEQLVKALEKAAAHVRPTCFDLYDELSKAIAAHKARNVPTLLSHDLYKDGDSNIPEAILDRNGEVVLGLCKRCGRAECELDEPCVPKQDKE